jgi:hypothetical protein
MRASRPVSPIGCDAPNPTSSVRDETEPLLQRSAPATTGVSHMRNAMSDAGLKLNWGLGARSYKAPTAEERALQRAALQASDQSNRARNNGSGGAYGPAKEHWIERGLTPPSTLSAKTAYGPTEDYVRKREEAHAASDAINRAKNDGRGGWHSPKKDPYIALGVKPPGLLSAKTWYAPRQGDRQKAAAQGGSKPPSPVAGGSGGGAANRRSGTPVPFPMDPLADLTTRQVGSRAATPPPFMGSRAATPPPFMGSRAATPPPFMGSRAATPPPFMGSRAATPPPFMGSRAATPPPRAATSLPRAATSLPRTLTPPPRMSPGVGMGMGGLRAATSLPRPVTPSWMQHPLPGAFPTPSIGSTGRALEAAGGFRRDLTPDATPLFATKSMVDPQTVRYYVDRLGKRLFQTLEKVPRNTGLPLPKPGLQLLMMDNALRFIQECESAAQQAPSATQMEAARALRMDDKVLTATALMVSHKRHEDRNFSLQGYANILNVDAGQLKACEKCLLNGLQHGLVTPQVP